MSYDTRIIDPDTGARRADVGNMTSNVGGMYRRAMPGPYKNGGRYAGVGEAEPRAGLPGLSGLRCRDAAPILHMGIGTMLESGEACAVAYLCAILVACIKHPDGVVAVNW